MREDGRSATEDKTAQHKREMKTDEDDTDEDNANTEDQPMKIREIPTNKQKV